MFSKSNKQLLTADQVRHLRDLYFNHHKSYVSIAEQFNITPALARKSIQGIKGYKHIEDNIPDSVKLQRRPAREKYAHSRMYGHTPKNQVPKGKLMFLQLQESESKSLIVDNLGVAPLIEYLKENKISYEEFPAHNFHTKVVLK